VQSDQPIIVPDNSIPDNPEITEAGNSTPVDPTGPEGSGTPEATGTLGNAPPEEPKPVTFAEVMPEYPGGEAALLAYVQKQIVYPSKARENGIQGVVYISFIVDKEGKVTAAQSHSKVGYGCEEEALRVIRSLPRWKPGKQNGNAVKVQLYMPVRFSLR
jgi:protein TonB